MLRIDPLIPDQLCPFNPGPLMLRDRRFFIINLDYFIILLNASRFSPSNQYLKPSKQNIFRKRLIILTFFYLINLFLRKPLRVLAIPLIPDHFYPFNLGPFT